MIHMIKLLLLLLHLSQIWSTTVYDVIVIGAGASGIAASKILNQHKIHHAIVQSRNRIGGRIHSANFQNISVDLGATFVHNPLQNNSIDAAIHQLGWKTTPAHLYLFEQYATDGQTLNQTETDQFSSLIKELNSYIEEYIKTAEHDVDLETAGDAFYSSKKQQYSKKILNRAYFELLLEATVNGADLDQISSRYYESNSQKGLNDYIPVGGYQSLLKAIYNKFCNTTDIFFNSYITVIDYTEEVITLTTANNTMLYAKRVISSIPLGVLKKNKVKFIPQLPSAYKEAIRSIGVGVFNKIIVSLNFRFWTPNIKILDFVGHKDDVNKYPECYVISQGKAGNILVFFVSGNTSIEMNLLQDSQIIVDLVKTLREITGETDLVAKDYKITRWQKDEHSLGSFSYFALGTKKNHFKQLSRPIGKKIWFVGQHTHPELFSNVHGAFSTGIDRALEVVVSLSQVNILQILIFAQICMLLLQI